MIEPSNQEIADLIEDLTPEAITELRFPMETTLAVISLDATPLERNQPDDISFENILGDDDPAYEQFINKVDLNFFLRKLSSQKAFVLTRSYGIPLKLKNCEIAEVIGCHGNDVTGIQRRALSIPKLSTGMGRSSFCSVKMSLGTSRCKP